ncbi:MAG: SHOCT domain-containing protein [Candidatus Cloacimonadota bacterium]|nr:SHOCT domain-containing protein [Candidatus Cloacimonadota bacterium]
MQLINNVTGIIPLFSSHGYSGGCALTGSWLSWVLWIFIIALVISFLHHFSKTKTPDNKRDNNLEILRRKFAEGEITKEEYEEKKRVLEDD